MKLASEHAYTVRTTTGGIHSGHDIEAQAEAACATANEQAKTLGIKTRYTIAAA